MEMRRALQEFSIKTRSQGYTDCVFLLREQLGEMAAIALPPQIAVPQEIRWDVLVLILNIFPMRRPTHNVPAIDAKR